MGYADFQLSYQVCPIVLVAGIAGTGVLPIANLLNPSSGSSSLQTSTSGLVTSPDASEQNNAATFGSFRVLPGGTLMDNDNAKYPLATMSVAANAIITNPLR